MPQSKEQRVAYQKAYREANKQKRKDYLLKNKERIAEMARARAKEKYEADQAVKDFAPDHTDKIKKQRGKANKKWRQKNPEQVKKWRREYYHRNKEKISLKRKQARS